MYISGDALVDYRSIYRSTIGRLSVDYRSTIGRLSVDCRPICRPRPPIVHMIRRMYCHYEENLYAYLESMSVSGNCTPTPPLTQQWSTDNKFGLILDSGRGRCAVSSDIDP